MYGLDITYRTVTSLSRSSPSSFCRRSTRKFSSIGSHMSKFVCSSKLESMAAKVTMKSQCLLHTDLARLENWPPRSGEPFDWTVPTNEAYKDQEDDDPGKIKTHSNPADSPQRHKFTPPFQLARSKLDYSYHRNPQLIRQEFQDTILINILQATSTDESKQRNGILRRPWIVFTAGPMGVGKSYVLTQLYQRKLFPLDRFIKIDPDMLKSELPEMSGYLADNPITAATKVHRESTQMADVLFEHSLLSEHDILVDGSLRDVQWYQTLFERIMREFPRYRLGILYVSATEEVIISRAESRAQKTGRAVPRDLLQASMEQVPKSVSTLAPLTNFTFEISNNDGQPMVLTQWRSRTKPTDKTFVEGSVNDWEGFARLWEEEENSPVVEDSKERDQKENAPKRPSASFDMTMVCDMSSTFNDERQHETARSIWGASYPKMCPRCALFCDGQCGVCIHDRHICACEICNSCLSTTSK